MYRTLEAGRVIETLVTLGNRIRERFPDSSLLRVSDELLGVAHASVKTSEAIGRPHLPLRIAVGVTVGAISLGVVAAILSVDWNFKDGVKEFMELTDAALNVAILIGGGIFFLVTVERRIKRGRALKALHELRSMAHIIDMHQLPKDPERLILKGADTAASPVRNMTAFELSRYFDYCSELLSMISKIAAIYAQDFDDETALAAVDEVEALTTGLSRKIWQKMMILNMGRAAG